LGILFQRARRSRFIAVVAAGGRLKRAKRARVELDALGGLFEVVVEVEQLLVVLVGRRGRRCGRGRGGEETLGATARVLQVQVGHVVVLVEDAVEVDWRRGILVVVVEVMVMRLLVVRQAWRLVLDSLGLGSFGKNI